MSAFLLFVCRCLSVCLSVRLLLVLGVAACLAPFGSCVAGCLYASQRVFISVLFATHLSLSPDSKHFSQCPTTDVSVFNDCLILFLLVCLPVYLRLPLTVSLSVSVFVGLPHYVFRSPLYMYLFAELAICCHLPSYPISSRHPILTHPAISPSHLISSHPISSYLIPSHSV